MCGRFIKQAKYFTKYSLLLIKKLVYGSERKKFTIHHFTPPTPSHFSTDYIEIIYLYYFPLDSHTRCLVFAFFV